MKWKTFSVRDIHTLCRFQKQASDENRIFVSSTKTNGFVFHVGDDDSSFSFRSEVETDIRYGNAKERKGGVG